MGSRDRGDPCAMTASSYSSDTPLRTIDEAAAYLRVGRRTVWRLIGQDLLSCVRIVARTFVDQRDLDAFIARSSTRPRARVKRLA